MNILVLDSTTKAIKGVLLSGVSTQPAFTVHYAEHNLSTGSFIEKSSDGVFNSTTDITILDAPASGISRVIRELTIYNNMGVSITPRIYLDNSGTQRNIKSSVIVASGTFSLSDGTSVSSSSVTVVDADATTKGILKLTNQLGGTADLPTVNGITETGGPTALTIGSIPDGYQVVRSGTSLVGTQAYSDWNSPSVSPTYSSIDGATGVVSFAADMTSILSNGMRVKYSQTQALTAYWTFDTNSTPDVGSFTMSNIATPTYTAGKFSNALTLNGTTQALSITDTVTLQPTNNFTVGCWFKTSNTGAAKVLFQSYSENPYPAGIYLSINSSNKLAFNSGKYSGTTAGIDYSVISGTTTVTDGNFHYVVAIFRNNFVQIYLDGALEASGYCITPFYVATNYIRIGCGNNAGTDISFMNGQIDDLFIINGYALDEQTVKVKYIASTAQGTGSITLTKYGIVTKMGNYSAGATLVTFWGGTDHSLVNDTISNFKYSSVKIPSGFPINKAKWSVTVSDINSQLQASPTASTWYNLGSISLVIPIGIWDCRYKLRADVIIASGTSIGIRATFSTATNSESNSDTTCNSAVASATTYSPFFSTQFSLYLTAKTTYYLNCLTGTAATTSISFRGDLAATLVVCTLSYL